MELENVKIFINSTRSRFRLPLLWEFFFSIWLESKLLFINQLIGRGGVGIGSETNIEIYRLCVGNTTGSLENTQIHKYQRGDFKIIQLNSPNLCVATLAVPAAVDETHLKIQKRRVPGINRNQWRFFGRLAIDQFLIFIFPCLCLFEAWRRQQWWLKFGRLEGRMYVCL